MLLYFQFRSSFIQSNVKSTCIRESFLSEQILFLSNESQNIVGWLYKAIAFSLLPTKETFMIKWERKLSHSPELEILDSIMSFIRVCSISANLLELQYKIVNQWHQAPVKMSKIASHFSDRFGETAPNQELFYMFYRVCPKLPQWSHLLYIILRKFPAVWCQVLRNTIHRDTWTLRYVTYNWMLIKIELEAIQVVICRAKNSASSSIMKVDP